MPHTMPGLTTKLHCKQQAEQSVFISRVVLSRHIQALSFPNQAIVGWSLAIVLDSSSSSFLSGSALGGNRVYQTVILCTMYLRKSLSETLDKRTMALLYSFSILPS